ncbi:MFS transporter [Betaproteobacteria bacterium]|nr:MFS transporter [Betaproteobacteria bacterium]
MIKSISVAIVAMTCVGLVMAQSNYPSRPIKLIVPWAAGGGVDTFARIIAQPLSERLGQPCVIENKPGAGGNIGTAVAAKEKSDGYSLLMASLSPNAVNPHLYANLGFDPVNDFESIALVYTVPNFLVVPANSPFNSALDVINYAKANPGKLNYGSAGIGSSQHLATIMLQKSTGIDVIHVPYGGSGAAAAALVAGQIDFMADSPAASIPLIEAGKLKVLAVGSAERNPGKPEVPTFDELGISGVHTAVFYGIMAPANTPKEIVNRLNKEINEILQTEEMRKRLTKIGATPGTGSPEDFRKYVISEIERYGIIIKSAGVKIE